MTKDQAREGPKSHESRKPDLREEKPAIAEDQAREALKMHEDEKLNPHKEKPTTV